MSCDGWSIKTRASVTKRFSPLVVRNFSLGMTRQAVDLDRSIEFPESLSVTVMAIFNEQKDHEMIVSYPRRDGGSGYALLSHQQIHLLRQR